LFAFERGPALWLLVLLGGVIGVVLVAAVFDWALIGLSSMTGAALIIQALDLQVSASPLAFLILLATGVLVQGRLIQPRGARRPPPNNDYPR
jgi:predicted membrane metal-binding protein